MVFIIRSKTRILVSGIDIFVQTLSVKYGRESAPRNARKSSWPSRQNGTNHASSAASRSHMKFGAEGRADEIGIAICFAEDGRYRFKRSCPDDCMCSVAPTLTGK